MPATMTRLIERDIWIANDGTQYELNMPPDRVIVSVEGQGMPPISYVSQRGPFQNGETLRDYFLTPRTVQMILRQNYCSRDAYWKGRAALLDILRPNRNAFGTLCQGTLRKIMPGNVVRDLTAIIQQGPNFEPRNQEWDEYSFVETLRFTAYDPTYYDPVGKVFPFIQTDPATFPMIFPVTFGSFAFTTALTYEGTWLSYPTLVVTGPISDLLITNVTTGQIIQVVYNLLAGRTMTIDLGYGRKTVILDDGSNLIGYVSPLSNLTTFALVPGVNNLTVNGNSTATSTQVVMSWFNKYLGI